jgi:acetylornithine deacetylase/succinyl-diaminopimelate desuccinylase-like protein
MYDLVRTKADRMGDDALHFTQRLVRTQSRSLDEENVAQIVERQMQGIGYGHVFSDDFGNVIGLLAGRESAPTVLLTCHMDNVVPEQIDATEVPQDGTIIAENLFGVGAADCKSGLATQIFAGALLRQVMLPLRGNLIVAATVAEENGCSLGLRGLIDHTLPSLGWKPDFAILGEPTDLGVYCGHDGWVDVDVCISGPGSFEVGAAGQIIYANFAESSDTMCASTWREDLKVATPNFMRSSNGWQYVMRLTSRLQGTRDSESVVGELHEQAERAANAIGNVSIDARIVEETQKLFNGRAATFEHVSHPWHTDLGHPLLRSAFSALAASGNDVRPGTWDLARLRMGTSGSAIVRNLGVPTIGYGPGNEEQAHRAGEWVKIDNITRAIYGTAAMLQGLIGLPEFGWASAYE